MNRDDIQANFAAEQGYVLVPILHMLKHPELFHDVSTYIYASGKFIQLNYAIDSFDPILRNLMTKGGTHVYLKKTDLEELLRMFQKRMLEKSSDLSELKVHEDETVMMLAQAFIKNEGISPAVISMIESSNKRVNNFLSKTKNIKLMIEQFRKNCADEYFKITFTNYICSLLLNHFEWKTPLILDKLMLASSVCDLALTQQDFEDLRIYENLGPLTDRVKNHPFAVIDLLKDEANHVTLETVTIIKQHHERPDGRGFPIGLDHSRINQLSALFIVSQKFVDMVLSPNNEGKSYLEVAEKVKADLHGGFFSKTCSALVTEVSKIV